MVLGEFLIILDAAFIGYIMGGGNGPNKWEILAFWIMLAMGVLFRYKAEKIIKNKV